MLLLLLALGCPGQPKTPPENTDVGSTMVAPTTEPAPPVASGEEPAAPAASGEESAPPAAAGEEPAPAAAADTPPPPPAGDTSPARVSAEGASLYGPHYVVTEGPALSRTTLTLSVRHGGGCEEHRFTLRAEPRSADAPTTQVLLLHHDDGGDRCRALVTTPLSLDVADHLGADCTERIELRTWPQDTQKSTWTLDLEPPVGCE